MSLVDPDRIRRYARWSAYVGACLATISSVSVVFLFSAPELPCTSMTSSVRNACRNDPGTVVGVGWDRRRTYERSSHPSVPCSWGGVEEASDVYTCHAVGIRGVGLDHPGGGDPARIASLPCGGGGARQWGVGSENQSR
jgi:hypothetical protein